MYKIIEKSGEVNIRDGTYDLNRSLTASKYQEVGRNQNNRVMELYTHTGIAVKWKEEKNEKNNGKRRKRMINM